MLAGLVAALALLVSPSGAWSRLPDPPFLRSGSALAWTGTDLLVWGGAEPSGAFPATGSAYDVRSRRWRPIPRAPIAGRAYSAAAWTGRELLVWGGEAGSRLFANGAAFDLATGRWRTLPRAPLTRRMPAAWTWTGRELVVWGDASRFRAARGGAAYDPRRDRWRRLPPAPFAMNQVSTAWLAGRMVVYGALLDGGNHSRRRSARGLAYDPERNRWQVLEPFDLSPQASTITAVDGRAVAWDYGLRAGLYDPIAHRWTKLPRLPLRAAECYPTSTTVLHQALGWYCGRGAVLDPGTSRWRRVQPPTESLDLENPVGAGGVALFLGTPSSRYYPQLWAYRP